MVTELYEYRCRCCGLEFKSEIPYEKAHIIYRKYKVHYVDDGILVKCPKCNNHFVMNTDKKEHLRNTYIIWQLLIRQNELFIDNIPRWKEVKNMFTGKKKCKCCGETKSKIDFYYHPSYSSGIINICNECIYRRRNRKNDRKRKFDRLDKVGKKILEGFDRYEKE